MPGIVEGKLQGDGNWWTSSLYQYCASVAVGKDRCTFLLVTNAARPVATPAAAGTEERKRDDDEAPPIYHVY